MLTFTFTGVDGTMTQCETLTSGMVGKQVQLIFDDSWTDLSKTVVFRAGDRNRVVIDAGSTVTIPEEVLARPFGKLFVGVYGTDAAGTIVIPTIMAEGPMIRYGADPMEDETAAELPVWKNLQSQIGNLSGLETENKENLVSAVNELHSQLDELAEACVGLSPAAAQLLVDILGQGSYGTDQTANIAALAGELGAEAPEVSENLILHWDFRTGSLVDQIAGMEATASEGVTLDAAGVHIDSKTSYILLPAGLDGATLSGNVLEVKFGQMTLDESAAVLRFVLSSSGSQPATVGLQWINKGCWSGAVTTETEFTDRQMFSGKTLFAKGAPDSNQIDWYCEDQLICTTNPSFVPTHISLGSTINGAFPMVVEYVKIYPDA